MMKIKISYRVVENDCVIFELQEGTATKKYFEVVENLDMDNLKKIVEHYDLKSFLNFVFPNYNLKSEPCDFQGNLKDWYSENICVDVDLKLVKICVLGHRVLDKDYEEPEELYYTFLFNGRQLPSILYSRTRDIALSDLLDSSSSSFMETVFTTFNNPRFIRFTGNLVPILKIYNKEVVTNLSFY